MPREPKDRLAMVARRFVHDAADCVRAEAASAVECSHVGSALGIRHHLARVRDLAERQSRIERHLLCIRPRSLRLWRAAEEALRALDNGSPRLARALARVEELTR